jgi:nucleotide-binding universal stress UspA family protein
MAGILVGVDGSDESKTALRWAVEEARLRRTALRAVYAWSPPYVAATGLAIPLGTVEEIQRDAEELLEAAFAEVGTEGVEVERAAVRGGASRVLVEAAWGADLLVVGSRGYGGFKGLLLGSVSQQCAQHATCPVVIVRGRDRVRQN